MGNRISGPRICRENYAEALSEVTYSVLVTSRIINGESVLYIYESDRSSRNLFIMAKNAELMRQFSSRYL